MGRMTDKRNVGTFFDRKIVIFVEGETDWPILERVLGKRGLENFCFRHDPKGKVPEKVKANEGREEVDGEICFGIVDRDTLSTQAEHLDLFLECDDARFLAATPFGSRVHVLLRWEIENYLIANVDMVARVLDDAFRPTKPLSADSMRTLQRLIALGDSQVPLVAACLCSVMDGGAHVLGENGISTWQRQVENRQEMESRVDAIGLEWRPMAARLAEAYAESESDPRIRWRAMNRLVDGKRILSQLAYSGINKERFNTIRAQLASALRDSHDETSELRSALAAFRSLASRIASEDAS